MSSIIALYLADRNTLETNLCLFGTTVDERIEAFFQALETYGTRLDDISLSGASDFMGKVEKMHLRALYHSDALHGFGEESLASCGWLTVAEIEQVLPKWPELVAAADPDDEWGEAWEVIEQAFKTALEQKRDLFTSFD